jgi:hypothetical protein
MRAILGITPVPLYYISAIAGFVMVAGGMWLIYKEKIYIDRESKTITEVKTPLGTFKTNIPALVLFVLGFVPLFYPIVKSAESTPEIPLEGNVTSGDNPVVVYAAITSDYLDKGGAFTLKVPFFGDDSKEYKIIYNVVGTSLFKADTVSLTSRSPVKMEPYDISVPKVVTYEPGKVAKKPAGF